MHDDQNELAIMISKRFINSRLKQSRGKLSHNRSTAKYSDNDPRLPVPPHRGRYSAASRPRHTKPDCPNQLILLLYLASSSIPKSSLWNHITVKPPEPYDHGGAKSIYQLVLSPNLATIPSSIWSITKHDVGSCNRIRNQYKIFLQLAQQNTSLAIFFNSLLFVH